MKLSVLSTYLAGFRFPVILSVLLLATLTTATGAGAGQTDTRPARTKKVLVLDPGHGGHDVGAGNPDDIYEKDVALIFSRLLAEKLKHAYTVHLTRSDDYELDLMHRPAVANYIEADLFLSIHTGASTLHNPNGMLIAYYDGQFRLKAPGTPTQNTRETGNQLPPWDNNTLDQREKSRHLAELLKEKFLEYDPGLNVHIQGMPIAVLGGANQPALLIEIGYLTSPSDLRKLKDNNVLADYTGIINVTLAAYFSGRSDL
jgi:N-acetylmuramoyl-L-alanine amidase